jgi:hypothetical protein
MAVAGHCINAIESMSNLKQRRLTASRWVASSCFNLVQAQSIAASGI